MYVCMYVCMLACMHACMYICIYLYCHHILFSPYLEVKICEIVAKLPEKACKFVLLLAASPTYRANRKCKNGKL